MGLSLTLPGIKYEMTPQGLLIRNISRQDGGGYICRARVAETGQLEERTIQLQVTLVMLVLSVMITQTFVDTRTSLMDKKA